MTYLPDREIRTRSDDSHGSDKFGVPLKPPPVTASVPANLKGSEAVHVTKRKFRPKVVSSNGAFSSMEVHSFGKDEPVSTFVDYAGPPISKWACTLLYGTSSGSPFAFSASTGCWNFGETGGGSVGRWVDGPNGGHCDLRMVETFVPKQDYQHPPYTKVVVAGSVTWPWNWPFWPLPRLPFLQVETELGVVSRPPAPCHGANLKTDPKNCGACGHSCENAQLCHEGRCCTPCRCHDGFMTGVCFGDPACEHICRGHEIPHAPKAPGAN